MITKRDDVTDVMELEGPLASVVQSFARLGPGDDPVIDEAFVLDDNSMVSAGEIINLALKKSMECFQEDNIEREKLGGKFDVSKTTDGTNQSQEEKVPTGSVGLASQKVVEPPYPPEFLAQFLEVDPTHARCVKVKVVDAVGRFYTLEPVKQDDNSEFNPNLQEDVDREKITAEVKEIRDFIQDANKIIGFEGVLERVWMDYEAIGWGAIEVIRSRDMRVRHIAHVPAPRVRVLKGWKGFTEILNSNKFVYYQNFGEKVVSKTRKNPITDEQEPYSPFLDGEIDATKLDWNLINKETGEPTNDYSKAANELIWITKHHSNTVYYGYTDVIPALGDLLSNVNIRDYVLQYFEHNTVPRYAITIEGAKIADPVKDLIMRYFNEHVKGKPHKTLIIPIPALRGEIKVQFHKLDADVSESSYQETRKNQSQYIMTAHGVSPAIIGIAEHSELGSGKGLSQAEIYKDRIVAPSQRRADGVINKLFRNGLGITMVELRHIPLDIRDAKAEQEVLVGYQESGTMTINEVRLKAKIGDPLEGGNRAFIVTSRGIVFVDELPTMKGAGLLAEEEAKQKMEQANRKIEADSRASKLVTPNNFN